MGPLCSVGLEMWHWGGDLVSLDALKPEKGLFGRTSSLKSDRSDIKHKRGKFFGSEW